MSLEYELGQILNQKSAQQLRRMYRHKHPALDETLRRYVMAGWNRYALAKAMRLNSATVRDRVKRAQARLDAGCPVPEGAFIVMAPPGVEPIPGISRRAPRTGPSVESRRIALEVLDIATLRRLRRLQKIATKCVMYSAPDSPERLASEELTHLLWELNQKGISLTYLDSILHLGHGVVHSRLVAHGYRPPTAYRINDGRMYQSYTIHRAIVEEATVDSGSQMH